MTEESDAKSDGEPECSEYNKRQLIGFCFVVIIVIVVAIVFVVKDANSPCKEKIVRPGYKTYSATKYY